MSDRGKTFEVEWRVENILPWLLTVDHCLISPQFLTETLANTRWQLILSKKSHMTNTYISIELVRDVADDYSKPVVVKYELSFVASDGSTLKSISCTTKFALKAVSQELNVKGVEILEDKKDAYLPEGVLTVRCKLWKAWPSISEQEYCLMRSVIGKKCMTLNSTIDCFNMLEKCSVDFHCFASSINISFDVKLINHDTLLFQKIRVDCKLFKSYYCELFALEARGNRLLIADRSQLGTLLTSYEPCIFSLIKSHSFLSSDQFLKNGTIALQLEITCYPGIKSEHIEYGRGKYKKVTNESLDLENVKTFNSEDHQSSPFGRLHGIRLEDKTCNKEKNESGEEDKYFNGVGKRYLPSITLKEDLTSLYKDHLFCDTKLQTDTETFPAHRCVLSARSPVFKKMFMADMKEKADECVNIPDISSDTVRRMLQFLYTDCTDDLDMQSAMDLYIASDKYDIASLGQRCISFMMENLSPSNVCEVLVFADMHQEKNLESAAQEYVLSNDDEVFYSDEWKLFMKNYSGLAAQAMYVNFTKKNK